MSDPELCPGLYCGRVVDDHGHYSDCQACPRGYRTNEVTVCEKCTGAPAFYDWLFLGFMALLVPILNCFFIEYTNRKKSTRLLILHVSTVVECLVSALCTLVAVPPLGSLRVESCDVESLADWYTMFYNPSPDYVNTIHCTQEAVYPLYTLVMLYYALCLAAMMLLRPLLSALLVQHQGALCIYAALYFLPLLLLLHAVLAGLIYYSYPYLLVIVSVITNAVHLSMFPDQGAKNLVLANVTNARNALMMVSHWLLYAYAIVAITQMTRPHVHAPLLLLVPFPALFYLFTVKFTDPDKLEAV